MGKKTVELYEAGTLVKLKSGSPTMVVVTSPSEEGGNDCVDVILWMDRGEDGVPGAQEFSLPAIVLEEVI